MLSMLDAGHDLPLCRAVAGKLVGDHHTGRLHLPLQKLAQQPLGCLLVAAPLDQDIEYDAGLVHGSPQPMLYPGNFEHDLIEMPFVARRLLAVPDPTPSSRASDHAENGRDDDDWNACPCCGGRMIIVEAFEPGCQPRFWPVPSIGLDSS